MTPTKLAYLKSMTSISALALTAGVSRQTVYTALNRTLFPSKEVAVRLASAACALCDTNAFEAHDFNPSIPKSIRNLTDQRFVVTDLDLKSHVWATAEELLLEYSDDIDLISALHDCVSDGERQLVHGYLLVELDNSSDDDLSDV